MYFALNHVFRCHLLYYIITNILNTIGRELEQNHDDEINVFYLLNY